MGFRIEEFVADCSRAMRDSEPQLGVRDVVERAVSNPQSVEAALGRPDSWGIDVIYNDDSMTILHFVWPPTLELFPHEHKMWSTVGIYGGIEDNTYYRRVGATVEVSGHKRGNVGDVLLMGADGIHSVENPTRQWTAALHVYGGDFFSKPRLQWDRHTGEAEPFALENSRDLLAVTEERARANGLVG
jgi:predicted metal-dependent enzyme (double-stranded beta helix superfamily)